MASGDQRYEEWKGEIATFGMSWFWFPEAQFGCVSGVIRTRVGYAGGSLSGETPTYTQMGDYTEAVEIEYDPQVTSFEQLLDVFWKHHDPTAPNITQYMSAIFYNDEQQEKAAKLSMEQESKKRDVPLTTKIVPGERFYVAEDFHQKYFLLKYPKVLKDLELEFSSRMVRSFIATRLNGYLGGYGTPKDFEAEVNQLGLPNNVEQFVRNRIPWTSLKLLTIIHLMWKLQKPNCCEMISLNLQKKVGNRG